MVRVPVDLSVVVRSGVTSVTKIRLLSSGTNPVRVRGTTLLLRNYGALIGLWLRSDLRLALPHPPFTLRGLSGAYLRGGTVSVSASQLNLSAGAVDCNTYPTSFSKRWRLLTRSSSPHAMGRRAALCLCGLSSPHPAWCTSSRSASRRRLGAGGPT